MDDTRSKGNQWVSEADLMKRILEVRFTDLQEEMNLCKQLLELAEPEQYTYGCAFANVYLMDSYLAMGDYPSCDFHLFRASFLCRKHGYNDLLLVLCNCAGLYYLKLNDESAALQYFLEGLKLTKLNNDYNTESKLLNNIGMGFADRGGWKIGGRYFRQAFQRIENHIDEENSGNAISYLGNMAEACNQMGDVNGSREALLKCEGLGADRLHQKLRLSCGWCSYYAKIQDKERCIAEADSVLNMGLIEFSNKYFATDMVGGIGESLMEVGELDRVGDLLHRLECLDADLPLAVRYQILCLRIAYLEQSGQTVQLYQAYKDYYEIMQKKTFLDDQTRAQSMLSKIQLTNALREREAIYQENRELENAGQLDELTGLYNRRYFNKLVSKISYNSALKQLGFIMLDVDCFKQYNDFYGHFMGDGALRAVAEILSEQSSTGIYVSRYGGDEFVCVCVNLSDEKIEQYVDQVRAALWERNIVHQESYCSDRVSLSIGYCNEPSRPGVVADSLLHLADLALYQVKKNGRNGKARRHQEQ